MKITPEEVRKIATLARLELDEDKVNLFAGQFDEILQYMDKLAELDTTEVEPMYTPVEHTSVLREDIVRKDYTREEILGNAPEEDGRYFIVPKIL
ncbi:MAG: Asp-tRNA(Asn)/Glu-tRNA(Gln) amidotransferase subunit GatC [Desulfovibrionales bacterium]